jgi:hypothetical protein
MPTCSAALLFRDRKFALIVSDTESQATNFLSDLKDEMINNEDLINLFGIKGLIKDSQTDIIVEFTDGEQFRVLVRGAEQRVRGLKWDQRRPDLIICDDLEGDEQVQSKDRREKFRRWFYAALLSLSVSAWYCTCCGNCVTSRFPTQSCYASRL